MSGSRAGKIIRTFAAVLISAVCGFGAICVPAEGENTVNSEGGGLAVTGQTEGIGYAAKLYNADNGLPTSEANTITSSSDGFIWIGGYSGLIRYDGTTFERQDSSGGITSVNAVFEDSTGRLWIGTNDNGLVCLHNGESRHFSTEDGLLSTSVNAVTEDGNGNILVGTKQGLCYFDRDYNIGVINDSQIKNTYITEIKTAKDGAVIGNTSGGAVFRIRDLRMTDFFNGADIGAGEINAILPSPDYADKVWLGSNTGLLSYGSFSEAFTDLKKTEMYYDRPIPVEERPAGYNKITERILASDPINCLYYSAGRIWVLMTTHIFYADWTGMYWQLGNMPLNAGIEDMCEDFEGNLWFTSRRQGVMKIAANKFFDLSNRAGFEPRVVNTTCMHDEKIYIGTDTGLQLADRFYTSKTGYITEYIGDARIRCLLNDSGNNLWISTFSNDLGLVCYTDENEIISFTEADGLPSNMVRCTVETPDGAILAATNGGAAVIRNGKIERVIDADKGLSNTVILTAEATADGKYYLGSDGDGIYVADGNNITHLSRADGLTSDIVMRIKNDEKRGVLWIITSNSIEYMKDGVIKQVEGFPYTNNYDIYFDSEGNAWVLASNGLYVVNADDLISKSSYDYLFFNTSDGLACVPTANSFSYLNENGDLYIAGRSGVSRVNIDNFFVESHDIKFAVPFIEDDKNRYYPDENGVFTIPPTAENITIYGYALTYMMHDPQIQYFLKGADNQPNVVNKSGMQPMRYTNLSGGTYEYRLSLIDSSTHTARQTVTFTIEKQPALYEQWWFTMFLVASAFVVAIILINLLKRRQDMLLRKKEAEANQMQRLFEQTATALVNAIDAKDKYTHGHSSRVAVYSRKIAEMLNKSEEECNEIYYAALLHDVGKIGIPGSIINKDGKLTDEEYKTIKQHPSMGGQILQSISEYPYLSIGAMSHHERYDGRGYPNGLKGTDIPEIARIVAVADAYDAMTSKRSYRDPIPQQKVREEFVKGAGSQFDPDFARLMVHLIDVDTEYEMKEREDVKENSGKNEFVVGERRSFVSEGILLTPCMTTVNVMVAPDVSGNIAAPSMILFDSLDGREHNDERNMKDLMYFEYAEVWFDGHTVIGGARKTELNVIKNGSSQVLKDGEYKIDAVKIKDHVFIRIIGKKQISEVTIALPDSARYAYIGLTGVHCRYSDVRTTKSEEEMAPDYIRRIAEEVSYINVPAGVIPNVQIDGYRSDSSEGIPVKNGMKIVFHTMSLPTARLVWHCAFINLFGSVDGKVGGASYRDLALMRIDGECWECDPECDTTPCVSKNDGFEGWDAWKKYNMAGFDCTVAFAVDGRKITVSTENAGIMVKMTAVMPENINGTIYAALTGDQVAITNIRIVDPE